MLAARAFTAVRPTRPATAPARRTSVVVLAIKPTQAKDFSGLSDKELNDKIGTLKRELASVRWLQRTRGIEEIKPGENQPQPDPEKAPKAHQNKHLRRQVAQCATLLRQRQIAVGIDSRQARSLEKKALLAVLKGGQ